MSLIFGQNQQVGQWIHANGGGHYREGCQCIGLERDERLVAGVMYDYCNGASIYVHVACIGQVTRGFLQAAFYYPFCQLGVNVLIGLVASNNKKAQRFDERLGFRLAHSIPNAHPSGSLYVYTMHRNECRWIDHVETKPAAVA